MKVNIRMLGQPVVVFLVRTVIVEDDMDVLALKHLCDYLVHQRLEVGAFLGRGRWGWPSSLLKFYIYLGKELF